jgi:hypothetical protein
MPDPEDNIITRLNESLSHIQEIDVSGTRKLYDELLHFFSEAEGDFIRRRHKELQLQGFKNKEIYLVIKDEIGKVLFKGSDLSERQIKRVIYKET